MTFHLTCVHIIFILVSVAKWQPFWDISAHSVTIYSLCILTIYNISYFVALVLRNGFGF